ncbi:MAG: hypothetical protein ACJ8JD_04710 [Chthoniobacterales bacterium]
MTIKLRIASVAAAAALVSLPAYASGSDDVSPTPSPSATAFDDHGVDPSPSPSTSPNDPGDDHGVDNPSPSPSTSPHDPGDDHGVDHPSPSPSPGDDNNDDHGGKSGPGHGDISLHGLYEGATSDGGLAVFYVEKGSHLQVNVIDVTGQTIGFAEGEMANHSFAFTLSNGQSITGSIDEHVVSGTVGSATFQAQRAGEFGNKRNIAGRFAGVANGPSGESRVLFVIDTNGKITMVQTAGTAPNFVRTGGFGTITAPVAPATKFTFTLSKTVGSSSAITGSFTVTDGVFQGTFTTSAGTFTVNTFKSSLANRMANISTRGLVGSGQGQLIGGFIITGGPKLVMIRAIGPSMAALGVSPVLDNPSIQLFSGQTLLASNDDWKANANTADILASGLAPTSELESALLVRLEPGAYTTVVTGTANSATGIALVEVYEAGND